MQTKNKIEKYTEVLNKIKAVTLDENDFIANISNIIAILKQDFDFFWVGVYFVKQKELVLGPFQGQMACTRIAYRKGVCGSSWHRKETIVVPDVHLFEGHIACSAESKSEIVVPAFDANKNVFLVLDIDSDMYNSFDVVDKEYLEKVVLIVEDLYVKSI